MFDFCHSSRSSLQGAPLRAFLKRFSEIEPLKPVTTNNENDDINCTHSFIKFLQWPDEESVTIDLRQAAVLLMANLDRLATPYIPSQNFNKVIPSVCFTIAITESFPVPW